MKIISIFNNKGGVGKTTYMYHIAHLLAKQSKTVLVVDLDSQCNLSAYSLSDAELERSWKVDRGNSIWNVIEQVSEGLGDFRKRKPSLIKSDYPKLYIVPGDVLLSNFEDRLGDTWTRAIGGDASSLRIQSAIYRYVKWAAEKVNADVVMLDLGPNLGALNRSVLAASDYFIIPMSPDLFSIRGTINLGKKLQVWQKEWKQCKQSSKIDIELPKGTPIFLGYVMQQYNIRENEDGMTRGWSIFGDQIASAVKSNIIDILKPLNQVHNWSDGNFNIGKIPNLHSLVPYSLAAKKPVFDCSSKDGLKGAHITTARESSKHFDPIVKKLMAIL